MQILILFIKFIIYISNYLFILLFNDLLIYLYLIKKKKKKKKKKNSILFY